MSDEDAGGTPSVDVTPPADTEDSLPAQATEYTTLPEGTQIDVTGNLLDVGPGNNWFLSDESGKMFNVSRDDFWDLFLQYKINNILQEGGTTAEIEQLYTNTFGNEAYDPRVLDLISEKMPSFIQYLPDAEQRLQNYTSVDDPSPVPANQIDVSDSQGVGSLTSEATNYALEGDRSGDPVAPFTGGGKTGGDPVVLFTGQVYHQVVDLEVNGCGLHFSFIRTYFNQTLYKGPLGYNWDHSYNLWLREEQRIQPNGILQNVVYRSTGQLREDPYIQIVDSPVGDSLPLGDFTDAVFQAPAGFFDRLEKSGGKYILETVAGLRYEYNDDLYINSISDLNGNKMTFEYTNNLLTIIKDPVGKEFVLEYDEMNRIIGLYDKTGNRKISYDYGDNGDLEEVDLLLEPDLIAGTDYRYMGPTHLFELQHNLVEILSPMGESVLENEYGRFPGTWEFNRVVRQRSADGEYRYEYGPVFDSTVDPSVDPINVPIIFTRVFYPNDHCIEHWFNNQGNVVQRSEQLIIGESGVPEELVATYRYNEDALLIEEVRPDGSATEYHYQREAYASLHGGDVSGATPADWLAFGNLLKKVERPRTGLGEVRRIVTDYTYFTIGNRLASQKESYYADPLLIALPGQIIGETKFDYDNHGNLVKIRYPDVHLPDNTLQSLASQEFIYNNQGLITDSTFGSMHIQYVYFHDTLRSGFIQEKIEDADGVKRHLHYSVDSLGRITQTIGYYGATTDIEWTTFDTPKNIISPEVAGGASRSTTSYKYNRNRQVTQVEEELRQYDGTLNPDHSLVKTYVYDSYGRLIEYGLGKSSAPNSRVRKKVFNPLNLPEKEVDFVGNVTFMKYDERMLLHSITRGWGSPEQTTRIMRYDQSSKPVEFVDGLGFKTFTERDGFGRPHIIRDPDGNERDRV